MKLLKENYEGLKELKKLPQYLIDFLSVSDTERMLKNSDFKGLYDSYDSYCDYYRVAKSYKITQFLNSLGIDPLNYLDYIPDRFLLDSGIKSITIPGHIKSIGEYAFAYCRSLTSITIPDSVTSIKWRAFSGCTGLTSVTIGSGVTTIIVYTFEDCSSLASITIPDHVTSIDHNVFGGCRILTSINYTGTKEQWSKIKLDREWNKDSAIKTIHCIDGDIEL